MPVRLYVRAISLWHEEQTEGSAYVEAGAGRGASGEARCPWLWETRGERGASINAAASTPATDSTTSNHCFRVTRTAQVYFVSGSAKT